MKTMPNGKIRRWIYRREVFAATHLMTIGQVWAANAARRLRDLGHAIGL